VRRELHPRRQVMLERRPPRRPPRSPPPRAPAARAALDQVCAPSAPVGRRAACFRSAGRAGRRFGRARGCDRRAASARVARLWIENQADTLPSATMEWFAVLDDFEIPLARPGAKKVTRVTATLPVVAVSSRPCRPRPEHEGAHGDLALAGGVVGACAPRRHRRREPQSALGARREGRHFKTCNPPSAAAPPLC
jgi:hypothetical protein